MTGSVVLQNKSVAKNLNGKNLNEKDLNEKDLNEKDPKRMLEVPELETICSGLSVAISGYYVKTLSVNKEIANVPDMARYISGKRIYYLFRSGKYIIISFIKKSCCFVAFDLSSLAQFVLYEKEKYSKDNIMCIIDLRDTHLVLKDKSTKSKILYFHDNISLREFLDANLPGGKDPLKIKSFNEFNRLVHKNIFVHQTIEEWLRSGKVLQCVGPYLTSEILFVANIHPLSDVSELTKENWKTIFDAMQDTIKLALKYRGASLEEYTDPFGAKGEYQNHFKVYNKEGANQTPKLKTFFFDSQQLLT